MEDLSVEVPTQKKPEVTPEVSPEITQEVIPEVKPEVKQEVAPEVKQEVTPEVIPEVDTTIKTKFTGHVRTSDRLYAGTDAKVNIWFTDSTGKTAGPITMQEKGGDSMERGQVNQLIVNLIDKDSARNRLTNRFGMLYKMLFFSSDTLHINLICRNI